jgi:hypothetical protein
MGGTHSTHEENEKFVQNIGRTTSWEVVTWDNQVWMRGMIVCELLKK